MSALALVKGVANKHTRRENKGHRKYFRTISLYLYSCPVVLSYSVGTTGSVFTISDVISDCQRPGKKRIGQKQQRRGVSDLASTIATEAKKKNR